MLDNGNYTYLSVKDLVVAASKGDETAWEEIVTRFDPLIRAIAHEYNVAPADVEDVKQNVWMKLLTNIDKLRLPQALPGWIATTTARICLAVTKRSRGSVAVDPTAWEALHERMSSSLSGEGDHLPADTDVECQEVRRIVRRGLAELKPTESQLLLLLVADPRLSYVQIARRMQMPVGSIGPTRTRCLRKLQYTDAFRHMEDDTGRRAA